MVVNRRPIVYPPPTTLPAERNHTTLFGRTPVSASPLGFTSIECVPPDWIAPAILPVLRSTFTTQPSVPFGTLRGCVPIQSSPPGVIFNENVLPKPFHSPMYFPLRLKR